jgi:DNA-binding response OmpR family regulator
MTDTPAFCPSCGFNIRADRPVERGPWLITPQEVRFYGVKTALALGECNLLHSLATAYPCAVSAEALANRASEVGSIGAMKVRLTRIRAKLGDHHRVIETVVGQGYRWCGP